MQWRPIVRIGKTIVAATALALGLWVLLADRYGQFITDGVTNAPLVELMAPTDGMILTRVEEGDLVAVGQELAVHMATSPSPGEDSRNPLGRAGGSKADTPLVADVNGVLWHWRTTSSVGAPTGGAVADVADCTRLFVVTTASEARVRDLKVGDKATFSAGSLQWDGSVQRLVAGTPNLTSRLAVQLPAADADSYLVFVKLEVPHGGEQYCAVGLRGRIEFHHEKTGFLDLALRPRLVEYALDRTRNPAVSDGPAVEAPTSWK